MAGMLFNICKANDLCELVISPVLCFVCVTRSQEDAFHSDSLYIENKL